MASMKDDNVGSAAGRYLQGSSDLEKQESSMKIAPSTQKETPDGEIARRGGENRRYMNKRGSLIRQKTRCRRKGGVEGTESWPVPKIRPALRRGLKGFASM